MMQMKRLSLFRREPTPRNAYDHERLEPAIRCSICNGEQVAGFVDRQTGKFSEIALLKTPQDLAAFMDRYGITGEIRKIY